MSLASMSVARVYGVEFQERPLMGVLSDLLGIPHFTTARGSTVRRDFLEAVATALGVPVETVKGMRTKDDVLTLVVETATGRAMDADLVSEGETVTNKALQVIIDGIVTRGVVGRPQVPETQARDLAQTDDDLDFDPAEVVDERDRRLMAIAAREGRDKFRTALLEAYGGRCAVTGYDAPDTLQAAHIFPYMGPATNRVTNGLLLRADIHLLFDRGAITVHERTYEVLVKPHLERTEYSAVLGGHLRLRLPRLVRDRPATAALRSHREWAGL